ncbi:DUF4279 domain-containing protein [Streptomyces goshikiensis]|uniref:DUF4279 domain-containing protein n=1 Tax=Streptomyces TaxID=1883 RepID=UPI00093DD08B|nr:DUF4279 domain-containing protein [Streptomyces sp. CB03578]
MVNPRHLPVDPANPFCQIWKVVCREPYLRVDEQIAHVLGRLRPQTERIAELMKQYNSADDEDGPYLEARLEVVRTSVQGTAPAHGRGGACPRHAECDELS